uniref:Ribosomal protein S20 n=1 Tax=Riquetophycus sp. TaxID=1897556 RepID=A0A1C9C802_9FLOR|nr:ribosomal protein S20 [Riquetophycus sp.]
MSKNLSAIKKVNVSLRNRSRNRIYKSTIKTLTRTYLLSLKKLDANNSDEVLSNLSNVYSAIDKAIKCRVLHKNNGSRKKSMLAKAMKKKANA